MRWIAVVAVVVLVLWALPAHAQPAQDEAAGATQPPPVGGLFGLFGRSQPKRTPSPREEVEKGAVVVATPTAVPPEPTETPEPADTENEADEDNNQVDEENEDNHNAGAQHDGGGDNHGGDSGGND